MTVELRAGGLDDFFASARQTAKEIDEKRRLTPKNIIWVSPADLMAILKPERTRLVRYLREHKRVPYSQLVRAMRRTPVSLNNDLEILSRYRLVKIFREPNPGHGVRKVIEAAFGGEEIEFRAVV